MCCHPCPTHRCKGNQYLVVVSLPPLKLGCAIPQVLNEHDELETCSVVTVIDPTLAANFHLAQQKKKRLSLDGRASKRSLDLNEKPIQGKRAVRRQRWIRQIIPIQEQIWRLHWVAFFKQPLLSTSLDQEHRTAAGWESGLRRVALTLAS